MPGRIELTLAEQLRITEQEIQSRLQLFAVDEKTIQHLTNCRSIVLDHIDSVVDKTLSFIKNRREFAALVGDSVTADNVQLALRQFTIELFSGVYGVNHANHCLRIGMVHQRLGIPFWLFLGTFKHLTAILHETLQTVDLSGLPISSRAELGHALDSILFYDMQFIVEGFTFQSVSAERGSRLRSEEYVITLKETANKQAATIQTLSDKDSLTELPNQRVFYERLKRDLSQAQHHQEPLSLVFIGLNGFKEVNRQEGRQAGDRILIQIGEILKDIFLESATACRFESDEFCVIIPAATQEQAAEQIDSLIDLFKTRFQNKITLSIGLVQTGPQHFISRDELVMAVDASLYEAACRAKQAPGFHVHAIKRDSLA